MKQFKEWLGTKTAKMSMALSAAAVAMLGAASAAGGEASATVISSLESGFTTMANDALSAIGKIVVIALPVAGAIFLARKAISWFKSIAK